MSLRVQVLLATLILVAIPGVAIAQQTDVAPIANPAPTPTADEAPELVRRYQASITADDLASHLYLFASDFFEGRETAERGQKLAAHYLASQYRKMGVPAAGTVQSDNPHDPRSYFQPFPLYTSAMKGSELTVHGADGSAMTSLFTADEQDGHSAVQFGTTPSVEGGIVFGGYGISDSRRDFDEIAALGETGIDLSDKWLMVLAGEPVDADGKTILSDDGEPTRWGTSPNAKFGGLMRNASPAGVLYVVTEGLDEMVQSASSRLGRGGRLSLDPPDGSAAGGGRSFPTMFMVSAELADAVLSGSGHTVSSLSARIGADRSPTVFEVEGASAASSMNFDADETSSENVLAFIEGSDPELKDEIVVISSHYDHVGVNESLEGDGIFNGADDDGSGTVAVLEIAEAFVAARRDGYGPRRSVLFINVSGEEKGLLGSAYYTDREPVFPLENTVTNINIDMIGRADPTHPGEDEDYVYIIGSNLISQELHDINLRMNELTDIDIDLNERFNSKDDPNQFYRRSDHWNFGKNNIPFIFFFTGTHEDYHGVDDEPEKILYDRMARISQLIFATTWQVANQDARPAVSGAGFN